MKIKYRINGEPAEVCYYESPEERPDFPMVEIRSRFGIRRYESLLESVVYPAESEDWNEESGSGFPMELEGAFLLFADAVITGMVDYFSDCTDEIRIEIPDGERTVSMLVKFSAMVDEGRPEIGYLSSKLLGADRPAEISPFPLYDLSFTQYDGFSVIEGLGVCVDDEYLMDAQALFGRLGKADFGKVAELVERMILRADVDVSTYIKREWIEVIGEQAARVSFEELPDDTVIGCTE